MLKASGIENNEFLEYKGRPLVRQGDDIYYGDLADKHYVFMMIQTHTIQLQEDLDQDLKELSILKLILINGMLVLLVQVLIKEINQVIQYQMVGILHLGRILHMVEKRDQ